MPTWLVLTITAWCVLGPLVGAGVGRAIRIADEHNAREAARRRHPSAYEPTETWL